MLTMFRSLANVIIKSKSEREKMFKYLKDNR